MAKVRARPETGMLYPDFFLPTGLQTGLMSQLTWGVLDTALAQAADWREQGIDIAVSVNLSMVDVDNPALAATSFQFKPPSGAAVIRQ